VATDDLSRLYFLHTFLHIQLSSTFYILRMERGIAVSRRKKGVATQPSLNEVDTGALYEIILAVTREFQSDESNFTFNHHVLNRAWPGCS
jgi:hypothetical protein